MYRTNSSPSAESDTSPDGAETKTISEKDAADAAIR